MNEEKREYRVSQATLALALGALGSKGVGFFREVVVAAKFGTGRAFDLYVAGSTFPLFLSAILLYGFPDFFVPYFARLKQARPVALRRYLFMILVGGAVFLGTLYFSAPVWVKFFAPGLLPSEISSAVRTFQILLLFVFGTAVEAVLRSFFQVEGRFALTAFSPLLTGLAVLGSVFSLSGRLSVYALAWGWAIGSLLPVATMLGALFFFKPQPGPERSDGSTPRPAGEWKSFSYVLVIAVLGQLLAVLDRFFGSFLPAQSLSAFYYASLPVLFPMGILIYPLGYAIFPKLTQKLSEGKTQESGQLVSKAVGWASFVLIPVTIVLAFQPEPVVQLLYQRGHFDPHSTRLTSACLRVLAFSVLPFAYAFIGNRVLWGQGKALLLTGIHVAVLCLKFIAAAVGVWAGGLLGLCWAVVLANWLFFLFTWLKVPFEARQAIRRNILRDGWRLVVTFGASYVLVFCGLHDWLRIGRISAFLGAGLLGFGFLIFAVRYISRPFFSELRNDFGRLVSGLKPTR